MDESRKDTHSKDEKTLNDMDKRQEHSQGLVTEIMEYSQMSERKEQPQA